MADVTPTAPLPSLPLHPMLSCSKPMAHGRHRVRRVTAALLIVLLNLAALPVPLARAAQVDPIELTNEGLVRLDAINGGALLLKTDAPGWYVPAPMLHTDFDVEVSGPIARTTVTQRFQNVADVFVEGTYVFPLPDGAAVDTLRMRVADRWIEGRVEGKEEAREIYEEAAAAGQVASLVEQQRPNVFTTSVANIAPNAGVIIQIEYQETLAPRDGVFGLRIPLVVAPRYTPAGQQSTGLVLSPSGWVRPNAPDARVAAGDRPAAIHNPVDISIDLEAGFPVRDITSPFHDIDIEQQIENAASIAVAGPVPADQDFYLSWRARDLDSPYAAAFAEHRDNETHYVALVTPPSVDAAAETRPAREVIFVQDTSGSMAGDSIVQARAGLTMALDRLDEADTFNIIEFDSSFTMFSPEPVRATRSNIERGRRFVDQLAANNGTEMQGALAAALDDTTPDDGRLRQVIFLTDGAVSNERQMLELIDTDLGDSRLFTVGIGSAPNSYFMTAAARAGRGSFVFIGDLNEVSAQMQRLFAKIETPAVVDLAVVGLPAGAEVSPSPLPDLYTGDPVALTIRIPRFSEDDVLQLTGTRGNNDWSLDVSLVDATSRSGVSKLWAREHIRDLEALWLSPEVDFDAREEIDEKILATALDFGLVSRLTSLVAVDAVIARDQDSGSTTTTIPTNLPDGWDAEVFSGDFTTDSASSISVEALDRLAAAAGEVEAAAAAQGQGVPLPATGAGWRFRAILGALLVLVGAVSLRHRERTERS